MIDEIIDVLACPACRAELAREGGSLRCEGGHRFDVARQGYVNLGAGADPGTGDAGEMVAARERFLGAGHFEPLTRCLAERAAEQVPLARTVVDAGAGTGHHLAGVLGALPAARGVALDLSKHALRRAARRERVGAVAADVWSPWPLRDACADVLLDVFSPRNAAEFARVLKPGGVLLVATPGPGHLTPLVEQLGLVTVDDDKPRRLADALDPRFIRLGADELTTTAALSHAALSALVAMGPSARHLTPAGVATGVAGLPDPVDVTFAFSVSVWRPR